MIIAVSIILFLSGLLCIGASGIGPGSGWLFLIGLFAVAVGALIVSGYLILLRIEDGPHGPPIWSILLALPMTGLVSTFAVLQLMHAA